MKRAFAASLLIVVLAACSSILPGSPGASSRDGLAGAPAAVPVSTVAQPTHAAASSATPQSATAAGYGALQLVVRWPARPPATVQLLPTSTQWLAVTVSACATCSPVVPIQYISRPSSESTTSITVGQIPQGSNYDLDVKAYNTSSRPVVGTSTIIAEGTGNVNIWPSWTSPAGINMAPSFVPTLTGTPSVGLTGLSSDIGKVGDQVSLSGTDFPQGVPPTLDVIFGATESVNSDGTFTYTGGATASNAAILTSSPNSIVVDVPQGATSGDILVISDGVPTSSANYVFWVASGVNLPAPATASISTAPTSFSSGGLAYLGVNSITPTGLRPMTFLYGATASLKASTSLVIPTYGTVGWPVPTGPGNPPPPWLSGNPPSIEGLGTPPMLRLQTSASGAGTIACGRPGPCEFNAGSTTATTDVSAVVGPTLSSPPLEFTVEDVSTVSVSTASITLPTSASTQSIQATVTTTLPFNDGVDWYVSETTNLSVVGTASSKSITIEPSGSTPGSATLVARAVDDPDLTATVSVTVN